MLTPVEIAEEIAQDLEFLEKELQDFLSGSAAYGVCSTIPGGCSVKANAKSWEPCRFSPAKQPRQVAGASLGDLMGLIDKSILRRVADGRIEVHELLRQYTPEKLESDLTTEQGLCSKHSDFYCQALASWERDLQGPRQIEATQEMKAEIDNIRAAWEWSIGKTNIKALTWRDQRIMHLPVPKPPTCRRRKDLPAPSG